jgi:hypothetical protein
MTATQYRKARRARGSKLEVAQLLGVHLDTIVRREGGRLPVLKEAEMALLSLPVLEKPHKDRKPGRPKQPKSDEKLA